MTDLIGLILELYVDFKHWLNVKKRRKFEKENNLPKKRMINPFKKIGIVILIVSLPIFILKLNRLKLIGEKITKEKIIEIKSILKDEKQQFGRYPTSLKIIIRNNPLRKNITKDYWKNEFIYTLSKDSLNYSIISVGKDQKYNTSDDIKATN